MAAPPLPGRRSVPIRRHVGRDLRARAHAQLAEHAREDGLDRLLAEEQARCDLAVRPAVGDQAGDFAFAWAQRTDAGFGAGSLAAPADPPAQAALLAQGLVAHACGS